MKHGARVNSTSAHIRVDPVQISASKLAILRLLVVVLCPLGEFRNFNRK